MLKQQYLKFYEQDWICKLKERSTTFVVYNPKIEGVRDKNVGDRNISTNNIKE